MKQTLSQVLCVFLVLCLQGCAREKSQEPLTAEQQAYLLLDQGKYSQAILYLERQNADSKKVSQRVELLASTYLAGAGIDVFSLYSIYQDDLLKKKQDNSILDRKKPAALSEIGGDAANAKRDSVRELIDWIDTHLAQVKQWSAFLSRFPKADSEIKHLYLERGLRLLFAVPEAQVTRSLRLYRLLIQVVWFRQWLVDHWLGELPEVMGLRRLCTVGLADFTSEVSAVIPYLRRGEGDAQILFPRTSSSLKDVLDVFETMEIVLRELAFKEVETRLRTELKCVEAIP